MSSVVTVDDRTASSPNHAVSAAEFVHEATPHQSEINQLIVHTTKLLKRQVNDVEALMSKVADSLVLFCMDFIKPILK